MELKELKKTRREESLQPRSDGFFELASGSYRAAKQVGHCLWPTCFGVGTGMSGYLAEPTDFLIHDTNINGIGMTFGKKGGRVLG